MRSTADIPPVQAVLFDAFGTLFDVYSVGALAEQLYPGKGEALTQLWRDRQIDYTRLVSMGQRWRPFWDLTRAALRYACARLDLELGSEREAQLLNQYRHLSSFPENKAVLQTLKARGIPTAILSNGDSDMVDIAVRSASLDGLFDHLISVERVQRFKPDPATYALGTEALGKPAKHILFVSSNGWDAVGATWHGYTTLWVNRAKLPLEALDTAPSRTGSSLRDVLAFFPDDTNR